MDSLSYFAMIKCDYMISRTFRIGSRILNNTLNDSKRHNEYIDLTLI